MVVTSVEEVVVQEHDEQTGIMKIKVVDNHPHLRKVLVSDLFFLSSLVLVVLVLLMILVIVVARLLSMI